jgi:hypothetical protein
VSDPVPPFAPTDTPPQGTQRPPTMAEVTRLARDISVLRQELALTRDRLPGPAPEGQPAPTRAKVAAQVAGGSSKWVLIALGALGVAAQVAAQFKPGLVSPLQTLIQMLQALGGQ